MRLSRESSATTRSSAETAYVAPSWRQRAAALEGVKGVREIDQANGFEAQQDYEPVDVPEPRVLALGRPKDAIADGGW